MGAAMGSGVVDAIDSGADNGSPLTHIVTYPCLIALLVILIIKVYGAVI